MKTTIGIVVLGVSVMAAVGSIGCGEEDASDVRPYTDTAGRSCNVDLEDISMTATCDVAPSSLISCEAEREAAIVVDDGYDSDTRIWTLRSCTACIDRPARRTYVGDCALVECVEDADCMKANYMCRGGACEHD